MNVLTAAITALQEQQARIAELEKKLRHVEANSMIKSKRIDELEEEIDIHDQQMRSHVAEEKKLQARIAELEANYKELDELYWDLKAKRFLTNYLAKRGQGNE